MSLEARNLQSIGGDCLLQLSRDIHLNSLVVVGGAFSVGGKLQLTILDVGKLQSVGSFYLTETALDVISLLALTTVQMDFVVYSNKHLATIEAPRLTHVPRVTRIDGNRGDINGMQSLRCAAVRVGSRPIEGSAVLKARIAAAIAAWNTTACSPE